MKKFSNLIIFIICFLLIFGGILYKPFYSGISQCSESFAADIKAEGLFAAMDTFTKAIEKVSTDKLSYHDIFMDINSVLLNLTNTHIVVKDDSTVVKTSSGYLANPRPYIETPELKSRASKVKQLANAANSAGAEFLYVMAPSKGYNMQYPANIEDFTKSNCDRFAECLEKENIPALNLTKTMQMRGITDEEAFFVTDHHWKPDYAFTAVGEICDYLKTSCGFDYDTNHTDISKFNITTYENWFLGSQGKKVGSYFTALGPDDINIILPSFETSFTEEQPIKGHRRDGSFAETVMYMENISSKSLYTLNPYASYSGGDFREQIITNHNNPNGATILLIRDSFACAASPFLALNAHKLYVTDVRDYEYYVGGKLDVFDYIDEIKPDYVIVLYNGVSSGNDLFDFD